MKKLLDIFKLSIKELVYTLSSKKGFLSSKRLERFIFTSVAVGAVIATLVYEIVENKLTALETTILIGPLLVAAGYNMSQTQKEKKEDKSDVEPN